MQITRAGLFPAVRPQSFQASQKARFGSQEIEATPSREIHTAQHDPVFLEELLKYESHLKQLTHDIKTGTIEFISAQDGLPGSDFPLEEAVWPQITFKLNQQRYFLTAHGRDQSEVVTYEIETRPPQPSKLRFHYYPQYGRSFPWGSSVISLYSQRDGQTCHTGWDSRGEKYFPKSDQGTYFMRVYPRQDLVDQSQELGILLMKKIGESMRGQKLGGMLLPEPLKQLDDQA